MKLAVITLCIGELYQKRWHSSVITKRIYCKKNGYDFIYIENSLDSTRKPHWSKIKALQDNLDKYDWIFYSDADAHFMNLDFKLENIIEKYAKDNFMIITEDKNMINSGNFFIKNNNSANQFLKDVYAEYPPKPIPIGDMIMHLNDQYGIYMNFKKDKYNKQIKIIPQKIINAYPCACCGEKYQAGDFLIHFVNHRRPTHNWGGDSKEPFVEMNLAEAKTRLYQYENLIKQISIQNKKLKNMLENILRSK
jgi:hypothetical protein